MVIMIEVIYNSNPNGASGSNHIAPLHRCKQMECKKFDTPEEAISFWFECSSPVTKLDRLMNLLPSPIESVLTEEITILNTED